MKRTLPTLAVTSLLACAAVFAGTTPAATADAPTEDARTDDAPTAAPAGTVAAEPLVVGHRGASGYRPEHTLAAYELAARMGADFIEPDLVSTKDHVLVARHENEIGGTTDVADHPEFAGRRTTKVVDGASLTGWFTEDFTLAELKTLRATERIPNVRQENTLYDGRFEVPTLTEVLQLRERLSKELGRTIGVYPETKHPTYFQSIGLPLEPELVAQIRTFRLDKAKAPIFIQSFELTNLVQLRKVHGVNAPLVFLAWHTGGPWDLESKGDKRSYTELLSGESLKEVAKTINGVGPEMTMLISRKADGSMGSDTGLLDTLHGAGLKVHPYTFRAENTFLFTDFRVGAGPADYGSAIDLDRKFLELGVDGLFCDQPDVCVQARSEFLADQG